MSSNEESINKLMELFNKNDNTIKNDNIIKNDGIFSFTQKKYNPKKNELCHYCDKVPIYKLRYKKIIIKVCKKCTKINRNSFMLDI